MKPAVLLVAVTTLVGFTAEAKDPRVSRTRLSLSGAYGVKLTQTEDGKCRLEVMKESDPHWDLSKCIGTPDDVFFVSDDGEKVWVLMTLPTKPSKRPKKAKMATWTYAVVAAKYGRDGKLESQKQLNDFMKTRSGLDDVRQLEKHFKWLEGVLGVPGVPPKINADGRVEFQTIDHKKHTLAF